MRGFLTSIVIGDDPVDGTRYEILVPVDSNEEYAKSQLVPAGEELSVTVVHVFEELDRVAETLGGTFVDDRDEKLSRNPPETVDWIVEQIRDRGIRVSQESMVGTPAEEILNAAEEVNADAILLAGRKRSAVGKLLFGATSQRVIIDSDREIVPAD